jgi:precorrin-6B methylase 1
MLPARPAGAGSHRDPALYDSAIRLAHRIAERGNVAVTVEVVPGLSSVQLLAARHGLGLTTPWLGDGHLPAATSVTGERP